MPVGRKQKDPVAAALQPIHAQLASITERLDEALAALPRRGRRPKTYLPHPLKNERQEPLDRKLQD